MKRLLPQASGDCKEVLNMAHGWWMVALWALGAMGAVDVLGRLLGPLGWMDRPSSRKQHTQPVPRVGGLVLLLMLGVALALGQLRLSLEPLEWAAVGLAGIVGILDDRFNLRARWKALVGAGLGIALAWQHAHELAQSGTDVTLFGMNVPDHMGFTFALLLMWFWGIPQAANLIDGLNGLSIGFSLLLLSVLALDPVAHVGSEGAPLFGILAGLLLFNYPRARHFMGDAGALSLGTLLAVLVVNRILLSHRSLGFWLMAYPILDVATVVAVRAYTRRPLGQADRNHMHHWLFDRLGGRAWLVPLVLLTLAGCSMTRILPWEGFRWTAWGGGLGLMGLAVAVFVDRALLHPLEAAPVKKPNHPFFNDPSGIHHVP